MSYIQPLPGATGHTTFGEELAAARASTGMGRLIPVPPSDRVSPTAAADLVDLARDLVAAAAEHGQTGPTRQAKIARAAEAARDARDSLDLWNVYGPGSPHSRTHDLMLAAGARLADANTPGARDAALERLALADQHRDLALMLRDTTWWADLGPLAEAAHTPTVSTLPAGLELARWLNSTYVTPEQGDVGPGRMVTQMWDDLPAAYLDPAPDTEISGDSAILDGDTRPWHASALAYDVATQTIDWSADGGASVELLLANAVDVTLEAAMLEDLAAAGTPAGGGDLAAGLEDAETIVGAAWPAGPDLIVCHGTDRPAIIRAYAAAGIDPADRPQLLTTGGATAGTALVMATGMIEATATPLAWMLADAPSALGKTMAALRYGLAAPRLAGAVATVTTGAA